MRESRETGNKKVNNKQIQIMVIITKKIKQNNRIENERGRGLGVLDKRAGKASLS